MCKGSFGDDLGLMWSDDISYVHLVPYSILIFILRFDLINMMFYNNKKSIHLIDMMCLLEAIWKGFTDFLFH
jgi:hypothetical protein